MEIQEFENIVKVEEIPLPSLSPEANQKNQSQTGALVTSKLKETPKIKKQSKLSNRKDQKLILKIKKNEIEKPLLHEPSLEGQEGFIGRRPIVDPFSSGEKVVYDVTYMGMRAGQMSLEVLPFVHVNEEKHYHFKGSIWTTPFFSKVYSVEDSISSMMNFETLLPTVYKLHVKESAQRKEARFYFNRNENKAFYWSKKITEKEGTVEEKYDWEVEPFSQDVFSSLFYFRVFSWKVGAEKSFRVADNKQNLIYKGRILRKETIQLPAGEFKTLVLEPKIELEGQFKPSGEIYIWLNDDDKKQILKIQAKVNIGSLKAEAIEVHRGQ